MTNLKAKKAKADRLYKAIDAFNKALKKAKESDVEYDIGYNGDGTLTLTSIWHTEWFSHPTTPEED